MIFEYKFLLEKYSMTDKLNEQNQKIKQKIQKFEKDILNITAHQKESAIYDKSSKDSPDKLGKKCHDLNITISRTQDHIIKRKKELDSRLNQNEQIKKNIVELEHANQRDAKQIDKLKVDIESIKKDIQKSEDIKALIETNFENSRYFEKEFIAKREL